MYVEVLDCQDKHKKSKKVLPQKISSDILVRILVKSTYLGSQGPMRCPNIFMVPIIPRLALDDKSSLTRFMILESWMSYLSYDFFVP